MHKYTGQLEHEVFLKINRANSNDPPRLSAGPASWSVKPASFTKDLGSFYSHGLHLAKIDSDAHVVEDEKLFINSPLYDSKINAFMEIFMPIPGSWSAYQGLHVSGLKTGNRGFSIARFNLDKNTPKLLFYEAGIDSTPIGEIGLGTDNETIYAVGSIIPVKSHMPTEIASKLEQSLGMVQRQAVNRASEVKKQKTNAVILASDYIEIHNGSDIALVLSGYLNKD